MSSRTPEQITITVRDAVRQSGLARTRLYQLIASDEIQSVKVGRRRLVLRESLVCFLMSKRRSK